MLKFLKNILGKGVDHKEILAKGAIIIDVRTPEEFRQGHVKGSLNIPLNSLPGQLNKIRKQQKPVVVCCRTGNRSGYGARFLRNAGLEAYNGGSWQRVNGMLASLKQAAAARNA